MELWFRQVIAELDSVRELFLQNKVGLNVKITFYKEKLFYRDILSVHLVSSDIGRYRAVYSGGLYFEKS